MSDYDVDMLIDLYEERAAILQHEAGIERRLAEFRAMHQVAAYYAKDVQDRENIIEIIRAEVRRGNNAIRS